MRGALMMVFSLLVSGCVTEPDETVPETTPPPSIERYLNLNDCTGFQADQVYPPGTNPGTPPAGWTVREDEESIVRLLAWTCDHVGLHDLERPATLMLETANDARPPEPCIPSNRMRSSYVLNALTDEPTLADLLYREYGLATTLVELHAETTTGSKTFTWKTESGSSSLEVFSEQAGNTSTTQFRHIAWETSTGIALMTVKQTYSTHYASFRPAHGSFQDPHLIGVEGAFAGTANLSQAGTWLGHIELRGEGCT